MVSESSNDAAPTSNPTSDLAASPTSGVSSDAADSSMVVRASEPSALEETAPDLDAIASSFDEIESALRRLDEGTYFASDPEVSDQPATPDGEQPAV